MVGSALPSPRPAAPGSETGSVLSGPEEALRQRVEQAYRRARRAVFDRGLTETSPDLQDQQRTLLAELEAAEQELRAYRHPGSAKPVPD